MSGYLDQVIEFLNANGVHCDGTRIKREDFHRALKLLKGVDIATAMPGIVHPTEFDFSNLAKNAAKYTELMQKRNKLRIRSIGSYLTMYMSDRHIFVVDDREDSVLKLALYIRFDYLRVNGVDCVTQLEIWRLMIEELKNITKFIFFDVLLPKADAIASDNQHTDLGKLFWMARCSEAFSSGYNVYLADQNLKSFKKLESYVEVNEESDFIWGHTTKHVGRRLIITKNNL